MERVNVIVVVAREVKMYIRVKLSLCWSRFQTRIPKMKKSLYVIAGPLQVPPTQLLTTCLPATALGKKYTMLT